MRVLGSAGVRVSLLCLGAMMFGAWGYEPPALTNPAMRRRR